MTEAEREAAIAKLRAKQAEIRLAVERLNAGVRVLIGPALRDGMPSHELAMTPAFRAELERRLLADQQSDYDETVRALAELGVIDAAAQAEEPNGEGKDPPTGG